MMHEGMKSDFTQLRCLVCNDKASGLHYGVVSCESCKSFFGRKIKSKAKFVCEEMGNCVMDLYTRRHCPACRLQKCLNVGMKPERVWDEKRLETRKPLVRKARKKKEPPAPAPAPAPAPIPAPLPSTLSVESTSSFEDFSPDMTEEQKELMELVRQGLEVSRKVHKDLITQEKLQTIAKTISAYFNPAGNMPSSMPNMEMLGKQEQKPCEYGQNSSPNSVTLNSVTPPRVPMMPTGAGNWKKSFLSKTANGPRDSVPWGHHPQSDSTTHIKEERPDTEQYSCQYSQKPPFQGMNSTPDFVDKSQLVVFNMATLGVVIRQTVQFAKSLPGFRDLTYEDQAILIKSSILEVLMFRMAETYLPEKNCVVDDITGTEWNLDIMLESGFSSSATKTLRFTKSVQGFNLNRAEIALLQAATLLSSDRPELDNPESVEEMQHNILLTLQASTKVNHPEDKVLFAKVVVKLAEVRELVQCHVNDLNAFKLPDHEKIFPLIAEIFNMDEELISNSML
ncbi:vitamin D3 receptor B-like isoform X2 [Ptychodera flava]